MKNVILLLTLFTCINYSNELIAQPTITSFTPTTGKVGMLVTISGTNLSSPTAFTIGGVSSIVVSNTGTTLVGMVMPGASTGVISISTSSGSTSTSTNFTLTSTLYPTTQQGSKLVGTGATGAAAQGTSIAISADGNTAIVGANADSFYRGAAWVYIRSGGTWTQQGSKLLGSGAMGITHQGRAVAISADGNTAIVGGFGDSSNLISNLGAAWIFTRNGSTWTQQGSKLVGTGFSGAANQGIAVSISADGNTAIVGGCADSSNKGAAWIYTRSGSTWTQQGTKLVGTGAIGLASQGYSVAMSADGNTAIIGGETDSSYRGATWIFTRSGSTWTQQGTKLVGTGAIGTAGQGYSVAISADGNTAIVGGDGDSSSRGAAWIFTRSGSTWAQQGTKLVGTGTIGPANQGFSVSISANGNSAIVGGWADSTNIGASWVYTRSSSTWTQQGSKLVGTGYIGQARQGTSVAMSADGNTAIVGGLYDNSNLGAAWVFVSSSLTPVELISFNALKQNKSVMLEWQTASELNNDYFDIERSLDNRQWSSIGKLKGNGTTNTLINYQFTDALALLNKTKNLYYRLRQIDYDGKSNLSDVRVLNINESENEIYVYPNPSIDFINLDLTNSDTKISSIKILNVQGQIISEQKILNQINQISTSNLSEGIYLLQMISDNGVLIKKIIIGK